MSTEEFTLSSGKKMTAHIGDSGEPEKVSWEGAPELSENEVYDVCQFLDEYGSEDDDDVPGEGEVVSPYSEENRDNALNTDYSV